jgi:hypothetical protein
MMPVKIFPEPPEFDRSIRQKGLRFLAATPRPSAAEWGKHSYWQDILPEISVLYDRICNYCATWIPHSTGQHAIDHFLDKSRHPDLAYDWSNYRYVSIRFNSRKGIRTILDPTRLASQAFTLNFTNFFLEVSPSLTNADLVRLAEDTIRFLKFNADDELVNERMAYYLDYRRSEISFDYLQKNAPFIAHEIDRQGLRTR